MDDRQLLEAAARAAEIAFGGHDAARGLALLGFDKDVRYWNPLADDGDALRLAVQLGITMYPSEDEHDGATTTWAHPDAAWITEWRTDDLCADMRRAIVKAAAAIGAAASRAKGV